MRPETIARTVLLGRLKLPLDNAIEENGTMYVESAFDAIVEAIKLDREKRVNAARRKKRERA